MDQLPPAGPTGPTQPIPRSPVERFVARRRARWERLSALLDRAGGRAGRRGPLSVEELDELVRLYRRATTDLAMARRDFPGDRVARFLNQLVSRAYGVVYRDPPVALSRLARFYTRELPAEYRAAWPFLVGAAALFFLPLIAAALAAAASPEAARLILPPSLLDEIDQGRTWFATSPSERPFMASFIMTHNVEVALLALGGGILFGVVTAAVLIDNGIFIGGVTGALIAHGLADRLVGFVSPHGFLELSVVVVSGAAGLMLGRALVWPGLRTRRDALAAAARRAFRLLLGLLPFLGIAGLLEGFVSPADFPWPAKLAIGLATAAALYGYLLLAGRGPGAGLGRSGGGRFSKSISPRPNAQVPPPGLTATPAPSTRDSG